LEAELRASVLTPLARVEGSLSQLRSADLYAQLESAHETVRAFARGVYPRRLEQVGLAALREMSRLGDHVEVNVPDERFAPKVEAAAYFLCVEALTTSPSMRGRQQRRCRSKSPTVRLPSRSLITASAALIWRRAPGCSDSKIVWTCLAACSPWRVLGRAHA